MKVLVTGGGGYIGSHMVRTLGEQGHDVVVMTIFPTCSRPPASLQHVTHLTQYFTDIKDVPASDEVFAEFFPDNYPARTVVQVVALVLPQLKLEVQATAVLK